MRVEPIRNSPIEVRGKIYDGPIFHVLMCNGYLWWAEPGVTRYLWHSNSWEGPLAWEDLVVCAPCAVDPKGIRPRKLHVIYRSHKPHYTQLPIVNAEGVVYVPEGDTP